MRRAHIYRPAPFTGPAACLNGNDATNGGVTSRVDTIRIFEENEEIPDNVTVNDFYEENRSNLTGGTKPGETTYWAAIPLVRLDGLCGPMDGGNIAVARYDGKPERVYHVHDRFETPELNEILSR